MRDRSTIEAAAKEETPTDSYPALRHHVLKLGLVLETLLDVRDLLKAQNELQQELLKELRR